jgi:hypothetical protein
MLVRSTRNVYRQEVENAVGKDATAKQVLDHIFGGYGEYNRREANFVLKVWDGDNRTFLNRLNMFWAMPLTLLLSPFMYLKSGQVGWSDKSSAGRFILRVTGHLRDE